MSGGHLDELMHLWAATLPNADSVPPFSDHEDLYSTIDSSTLGEVPWESFSVKYAGEIPETNTPPWMLANYDVWF